jgi:CheY-like chemotaxis protein
MSDKNKILVIDDSSTNLLVLQSMLEAKKYRVIALDSGKKALQVASKELPDLILLDIMMPGMNGFEVLECLKADNLTTNIPVIFVTAKTEASDVNLALKSGAAGYIKKPIEMKDLLQQIEMILK